MNIDYVGLGLYSGWHDGFCNQPFKKRFVNPSNWTELFIGWPARTKLGHPSNWTELQNSEFWNGYESGFVQGKAKARIAGYPGGLNRWTQMRNRNSLTKSLELVET